MQEFQELIPDEEMFRRVWSRVMPDESASPITVRPPGEGHGPENRPCPPGASAEDEELLCRVLEELGGAMGRVTAIVRRRQEARALLESIRGSGAQARGVWFLLTGRRWEGRQAQTPPMRPVGELLREQYLWELEFSRLCRELEARGRAEALKELAPELETESRRRRGMLRTLLAR